VSDRGGQTIPVARFRDGLFCGWVDLAPGAKIYLLKESGRVTAILTATDHPRAGSQWIKTDDNFSLQNILIALFGQPGWSPIDRRMQFRRARLISVPRPSDCQVNVKRRRP
jgi:hypothetical protein